MNTLSILGWALALLLVQLGAAVLIVSIAVAMCLWPRRTGTQARQAAKGQRGRIVAHFRRLFGSRKHPKHPVANAELSDSRPL